MLKSFDRFSSDKQKQQQQQQQQTGKPAPGFNYVSPYRFRAANSSISNKNKLDKNHSTTSPVRSEIRGVIGKHGGNYYGSPTNPEIDYVSVSNELKERPPSIATTIASTASKPTTNKSSLQTKRNTTSVNGSKVTFGKETKNEDSNRLTKKTNGITKTNISNVCDNHRSRKLLHEMKTKEEKKSTYQSHTDDDLYVRKDYESQSEFDKQQQKEVNRRVNEINNNAMSNSREIAIVTPTSIEKGADEREGDAVDYKSSIMPVEVWDSGPVLVTDLKNVERSSEYIPGEGKTMTLKEEGSRVWKHKTRRKYEEIIPKESKRKDRLPLKSEQNGNKKTDDDKIITEQILDEHWPPRNCNYNESGNESVDFFPYLDSYLPKMVDKGVQCNLKKEYKLIRSDNDGKVSTFSSVPAMLDDYKQQKEAKSDLFSRDDVIYSKVDKQSKQSEKLESSKHQQKLSHDDYVVESSPIRSRSILTKSPDITRERNTSYKSPASPTMSNLTSRSTKRVTSTSKNFGFDVDSGVNGPVVKLPPRAPTPKKHQSLEPPDDSWYLHTSGAYSDIGQYKHYTKPRKHETLEETISISNASTEDDDERRQSTPKSMIKEVNKDGKIISYENPVRKNISFKLPYDHQIVAPSSIWMKPVDSDYRRGMVQNDISYPSASVIDSPNSGDAMLRSCDDRSRSEKKKFSTTSSRNRDRYSPSPPPSSLPPQIPSRYDYAKEKCSNDANAHFYLHSHRQQQLQPALRNNREFSETQSEINTRSLKKFNSHKELNNAEIDYRRGGLAAAYRARQERASSLNRYGNGAANANHHPYGSQSQLNRSFISSSASDAGFRSGSRYNVHENDPVVLYIPAVSHHKRKGDEDDDDRLSGIALARTQSSLSKMSLKNRKSKKDLSRSASIDQLSNEGSRINGNYAASAIDVRELDKKKVKITTSQLNNYRPHEDREDEDKFVELGDERFARKQLKKDRKKDLKRSQSIPKDAKLPWLQKLRMKVLN